MPTTIVTGASRGIGTVICDYLARRGHHVIGLARGRPEGFAGSFYAADLTDEAETADTLARILAEHEVDNLVNNAGKADRKAIEDISLAGARDMMELNVMATIQCTQAVVAGMKRRGAGRIVNMASRALLGRERTAVYAASKAAVEALTRSWALELGGHGITVNAVAPGVIDSAMFRQNNPADSPETAKLLDRIPLHRTGQPAEVAAAVAYFLSPDAGYTTGQTLFVCGGWSV
ncbi:SDR family oxidoreductase [Novosphingobium album (ex Liu et al. 2023)]|uniref:SDR family oxidoreductase n=1 Tax=Novosphingobium album (ex Liu et al. 2023) TaxID=3031130 RepID=A0ABT5WXB5_9SPHN|nr:SDR family oxidoreductase [Novosphingobium album (ex Liu et al. 2023)]MDE8654517.1 SDR family oxidoreductase [Novosphingobium album (ex Liu et al. 2023)]